MEFDKAKINKRKYISLDYTLSYEEAYYTFKTISFNMKKPIQIIFGAILSVIVIYTLVEFYRDKAKSHLYFIGLISLLLLFYLLYYPVIQGRKGAKATMKLGGRCKFIIRDDGSIKMQNSQVINIKDDTSFKRYDINDLLIYQITSGEVFCIPKRVLDKKELEFIKDWL